MNNFFGKLSSTAKPTRSDSHQNDKEDSQLSSSPAQPAIQQPDIALLLLSNDNLSRFNSMSPPYRGQGRFLQDAANPVQIGRTYAVWPPIVERFEVHGLVTDGESVLFF